MLGEQHHRGGVIAPAGQRSLGGEITVRRDAVVDAFLPVRRSPPRHGGDQRRGTAVVGGLDIGAGGNQRAHGFYAAMLGGQEKRRLAVAAPCLKRRAGRDKTLDHAVGRAHRGCMQRGMVEIGAWRCRVGTEAQQKLDHGDIVRARGLIEGRAVEIVRAVDRGTGFDQEAGCSKVAAIQRLDQRHVDIGNVLRIRLCPRREQAHALRFAVARRPVERAVTVRVAQVDIGAELDQQRQHVGAAGLGGEIDG